MNSKNNLKSNPLEAVVLEAVESRIKKRRMVILASGLLVLALTAWGVQALAPQDGRWLPVERRDLVLDVEMEGELRAVDSVRLGAPSIDGIFDYKISFMAPEGGEVSEGTPVLGFDVTELRQRLQEQGAERDAAEKKLEKAYADFDAEKRNLELQLAEAQARRRIADLLLDVPKEVAARRDLEAARIDQRLAALEIEAREQSLGYLAARRVAELAALERRRERAAREVQEVEQAIEKMTVKAPRVGTVIHVADSWSNEKKKVGESLWRGRSAVEIPDLSRMLAEAQVAEADAGRLKTGQRVRFRLDAFPDREYRGTVQMIRGTVQKKRRSPQKIVRLEIELDETDSERMRPGMRLRGTIETQRMESALVVPREAVRSHGEGAVVEVRTALGRREVAPALGAQDDAGFMVLDGLEEGDRVLVRGTLKEGTP